MAAQGLFIDPPLVDGRTLKVWTVGERIGGVFTTSGAWESPIIGICEEPIDALSIASIGLPSIALGSVHNQPEFLAERLRHREVILALNADETGRAATESSSHVRRTLD